MTTKNPSGEEGVYYLSILSNLNRQLFFSARCLRGVRRLCDLLIFLFRSYDQVVELTLSCTGRDEVAHDHVLLQTCEVIRFTADGSFAQHLGRLLEGSGREPTFSLQ